jgi:hypothetical protein
MIRIQATIEDICDFDFTKGAGTWSNSAAIIQIGWEGALRKPGRIFYSDVDVDVVYWTTTTITGKTPPIEFFNNNGYINSGGAVTTFSSGSGGGPN